MAGTARRRETLPLFDPDAGADALHRSLARLSSQSVPGRSIAETNALHELERGLCRLSLERWESIAASAHSKYRDELHAPYRDVDPEVLALACKVRLAYVRGIWQSSYSPDNRVAQVCPRADSQAKAFDTFHEISEAQCLREGAAHTDVQWVTVAMMVERRVARAALSAHGLRSGVAALARTHRRIRRCFLWVRLAMVAASPE